MSKNPLSLHKASGHWCKKIKGKRYYFGKDLDSALERWYSERDDLLASKPKKASSRVTISDACAHLIERKTKKMDDGELSIHQLRNLQREAKRLISYFGKNRTLESIEPEDFDGLRAELSDQYAVPGLVSRINNCRSVFNFAYKSGLIEKQVRFGDRFSPPSQKARRRYRRTTAKKFFNQDEIQILLDNARPHLKAFILLGVNCGMGNTDIAFLSHDEIDLESGWLDCARRKTEVERRAKIWPETCEAIKEAVALQDESECHPDAVFVTRHDNLWTNPKTDACSISGRFAELTRKVGVYQKGKTFYALRHVFETVAGGCKDQIAVNYAMGHCDNSMAASYREHIDDDRLEAVAQHVHEWLFED